MSPRLRSPITFAQGPPTAGHIETSLSHPDQRRHRFATGATTPSRGGGQGLQLGPTPAANPHGGRRQAWQGEAWGYYDALGEGHNAASLMGAAFSRVRLTVGLVGDDGEVGPLRDDDGALEKGAPSEDLCAAAELHVRCLQDPIGGQAGLMDAAGRNLMVAGEGVLLGRETEQRNPTTGEVEVVDRTWEFLSVDEVVRKPHARKPQPGERPTASQWTRVYGDGRQDEDLPPNTYVQRIWKKHPRFSALADSSFQATLDIMEEIVLLTRQVRAVAVSRIAGAGVLFVPSEIDFGEDESAPEGSRERDPFAVSLVETMSEAVEDRASPASVTPMVVRADADMIDRVKHLDLAPADESLKVSQREEAIQRFAQGIDWPVELTVGHQSTTFANATQVSEDAFRMHIEPYLAVFVGHLTSGFLWPSLMGQAGQDQPVSDEVRCLVIHYDASQLITRPDRSKNALEAHDRLLLSNASTLRELGFDDLDAPDEDEVWERIRWQIVRATKESIRAMEDTTIQLLPDQVIAKRGTTGPASLPGAPGGGGQPQPPTPPPAGGQAAVGDLVRQLVADEVQRLVASEVQRVLAGNGHR